MTSLQARLSAGLVVALALLVVLSLSAGSYSLQRLAENFVAARLESDLGMLLAALEFDSAGQPRLPAGVVLDAIDVIVRVRNRAV